MDGLDDTLWSERMSDCHTSTTSGGGNSWTDWRTEAGSWSWLVLTGEGANDPTSSLVHYDPHLLLAGGGLLTGRARHLAQARLGLGTFPSHLLQSVHRVREYLLVLTKYGKNKDSDIIKTIFIRPLIEVDLSDRELILLALHGQRKVGG